MNFILIILSSYLWNFYLKKKKNRHVKFTFGKKLCSINKFIEKKNQHNMQNETDLRIQDKGCSRAIFKTPYTCDTKFCECSRAPTLLNTHPNNGKWIKLSKLHVGIHAIRPTLHDLCSFMHVYI